MKNTLLKTAEEEDDLDYERIKESWEDTVSDLRYSVDKPERFFRHYLMYSPELEIRKSVSKNTLLDEFEDVLENIDEYSVQSIETFVEDINQSAERYKNLVNANVSGYGEVATEAINRKLSGLDDFGSTQERVLLLYLLSEVNNETEIIRGMSLVETYTVRMGLAGGETGSVINQFCATTCSNMEDAEMPIETLRTRIKQAAPGDEELKISIQRENFTRSDGTRYILEKYESENLAGVQTKTAEIEHIAPRSAFDAEKYSSWVTYLDVGKEEFGEYKDKIGNLTIMEKRLNIAAGNNPFKEKKQEYQQSEFEMTQEIVEHPEWSIEKIERRTRQLAEQAPEIWNFEY
jgi:hypothetical protein